MEVILYCDDMALLKRWEKFLNANSTIIDDEFDLLEIRDSLVIYNSGFSNCEMIIDTLVKNNNKVLILDRIPEFSKASSFLAQGVKGYGNVIMSKSYFESAIEAILNNMIWLIPDITTKFVKNFINNESEDLEEQIFEHLTQKEKDIAILLKKGYTNTDIVLSSGISINTVKTHIKNIYKKLQVNDRISFAKLFS